MAWRRVNSHCGTIRRDALTDAGPLLDVPPSKRWCQKGGPEWNDHHIRLFLRYEPGTAVPRHGVDGINGLGDARIGTGGRPRIDWFQGKAGLGIAG